MQKLDSKLYNKVILIFFLLSIGLVKTAQAQQLAQEIRWLRVGPLHSWFAEYGTETEISRTGNAQESQNDGYRWDAQFRYQDTQVGHGFWIGTTNYSDPALDVTLDHKVVGMGPGQNNLGMFFPVEFKMVGKYYSPIVLVDGNPASDQRLNDIVDEINEDQKAERIIYNKVHTSIGITYNRKIMAFSNQNHDNYYIIEYEFENTGIVDDKGTTIPEKTLTDVYFFWTYRHGFGKESFVNGWAPINNIHWGRNVVNERIGIDPNDSEFEMRAQYSWYGRHSGSPFASLGGPYFDGDGHLNAQQFHGTVTLHADKSSSDSTDDLNQPVTTHTLSADNDPHRVRQFDVANMSKQYTEMILRGHEIPSHAEKVGEGNADQYGGDNGGFGQTKGCGPYILAPGEKVKIVMAEGVAGLSRKAGFEIGANWLQGLNGSGESFTLPDGSTTTDPDNYKDAWVMSGVDSMLQTFRRAISNYNGEYEIPQAPPPPDKFEVLSGGDKISLSWSSSAEDFQTFDGYRVYRAVAKPDTFYTKIFEVSLKNGQSIVNNFDDVTAIRGSDYYYYIETLDDGSRNIYEPGKPLTSSKFFTITNTPAFLRRPAKSNLDGIRIVPNPYDVRMSRYNFEGSAADRIAIYGLPPKCKLKIYTERGDLITEFDHTDGTGDQIWNSLTSSQQVIVSGVYIIYIEVTSDVLDDSGNILLKKGESTFKKFIVIR